MLQATVQVYVSYSCTDFLFQLSYSTPPLGNKAGFGNLWIILTLEFL